MSQEKVNRYKEEKANRKKILRRQKIKKICSRIIVAVIALAIIGYAGFSVVTIFHPIETTTTFQNAYSVEELSSILESEGVIETVESSDDSESTDGTEESGEDTSEQSDDASTEESDDDSTEESGEDTAE